MKNLAKYRTNDNVVTLVTMEILVFVASNAPTNAEGYPMHLHRPSTKQLYVSASGHYQTHLLRQQTITNPMLQSAKSYHRF